MHRCTVCCIWGAVAEVHCMLYMGVHHMGVQCSGGGAVRGGAVRGGAVRGGATIYNK